jgi:cytochrome c oxidase subunit 2
MVSPASDTPEHPDVAARIEKRWAIVMVGLVALLVAMVVFTGLHSATMPPSRVETIDPTTLHLAGEFVEGNLGSEVQPDGSVVVRIIGQQYSFTPQCIVVPARTPIAFRVTSADVVHGMLITGTNINSMVEPGFISTFKTTFDQPGNHLMPCHEFCGTGHEAMWANVKVVDQNAFTQLTDHARRATCDL